MTLTFPIKVPCNSVGFLSNKVEKPKNDKIPMLHIESNKIAKRYDDLGIVILKPIIDRLYFGFSVTPEFIAQHKVGYDVEGWKMGIAKSLYQDAMSDSAESGVSFVYAKNPENSHKYRFRYKPPSSSETIFLQVTPKAPVFITIDMNPAKFNQKAVEEIRQFVEQQFLLTGEYILYDDIVAWSRIYRLDIAVDVLGVRPSDLEVMAMGEKGPVPYKSHQYKSVSGRTETNYITPVKGKARGGYYYDKQKDQIEKGKKPVYGDCLHTRFEFRVTNTAFHKLENIQNRCARVAVRALDYNKFRKMGYTRRCMIRYALERRDVNKAFREIPDNMKPKYQAAYEMVLNDIWDAKAIWSFWKDAVQSLAIAPAYCTQVQECA